MTRGFCSVMILCLVVTRTQTLRAEVDFQRDVAPLLAAHCLECHHGNDPKGGLLLSHRMSALKGGESGEPSIVAGAPDRSPIWLRVESDEMPPKHPLSKEEKAVLRAWVEEGARWDGKDSIDPFAYTTTNRAGYDWWSLQPLRAVSSPKLTGEAAEWCRNPVDRFVRKRLADAELTPSPAADPRTLVRRLAFDLTGLPPEPEVIQAFSQNPSDEAYLTLVRKYLDSPAYGERWGRHWLDVVRFGESNGFERNDPRRNAWPYRDWVINAFNEDMPYDKFVRMQLTGDLLEPNLQGAAATGFWTAGVHNTVVGGSERMKKLAREDEVEDVLAALGQTFLGLTINCSRCHDHKYDPVTQVEYYQLASAISGLGFGERKARDSRFATQLAEVQTAIGEIESRQLALVEKARQAVLKARDAGTLTTPEAPKPFARWEFDRGLRDSVGKMHARPVGEAAVRNGALDVKSTHHAVSAPLDRDLKEKTLAAWVQLDSLKQRGGAAISLQTMGGGVFDAIVFGEQEPGRWMPGSNNFRRTDSFGGPAEEDAATGPVHVAIVYEEDGTITCYRNGQAYGRSIRKAPLQPFEAGKAEFLFGLRHDQPNAGRRLSGKIHQASAYDRALSPAEVAAAAGNFDGYVTEAEIASHLSDAENAELKAVRSQLAKLEKTRADLSARGVRTVYTLKPGAGQVVKRLLRGDPDKEGEVVSPRGVTALQGVEPDFKLPSNAPEAKRRERLAAWVTDANNPLLDRVIVNRVWHYHFGRGIVATPNDLGFNGGRPSHPDLLEWLAGWFRGENRRLKRLHELLVTSAAYRQASRPTSAGLQHDANNRLLWRMTPKRLEAEVIRDSMLVVAGKLNREMGGPSFEDVAVTPNNGTTYYAPKEKVEEAFFRRTVYRFNPRGGRSALLDTFDCPDPAATTPSRAVTTTPLQALSLFNNGFVLEMSKHFASRVREEARAGGENEISVAWRLALGRKPTEVEHMLSERLVKEHGLEPLCRGLFNVSEFVIAE